MLFSTLSSVTALVSLASVAVGAPQTKAKCRYLPTDAGWPSTDRWNALNETVGGRLITGAPVGQVCYGSQPNNAACSMLADDWNLVDPFINQPVSVVAPYWDNNTCSPFVDETVFNPISSCSLGNMASYAINVSDARTVAAGVKFARQNNIRLVVKNTGHDYLGGSQGKGALALWTHHLDDITLVRNYTGKHYQGAAYKIGAGVQFRDLYAAAEKQGLRVVGGSCPTVGANGGWRQGGGHGPLSSAYGMGADNTLEFEVVTADGSHIVASPSENSDLFYALAGGGGGNYAIVVSAIVKAHADGQVAGSRLTFNNDDDTTYWAAIEEWMRYLLVLDAIPGFATDVLISSQSFSLTVATLPGGTVDSMNAALAPFYETLDRLKIVPVLNETATQATYFEHYDHYIGGVEFTRNITIGSRLIPRDLVRNGTLLPDLTAALRSITSTPGSVIYLLGYNVSDKRTGNPVGYNAVTRAWRDALFLINLVIAGSSSDPWSAMAEQLAQVNRWQDDLRELTPGGGAYYNEGTYDTPFWKEDYFGGTYDKLLAVKEKYDPDHILWTRPTPGWTAYEQTSDGHLCKAS
ncbi:hypothetical protein F5Y08DRAFT_347848 [Xylaria arbuscula]|nr:hypothetical protein F5Y08DRAFT_347848 [Xylaria arbuscula]